MDFEKLEGMLGNLASDFMFLEGREIDVPSAGTFLNLLEGILQEAGELEELKKVVRGLTHLLEKIVLDAVDDGEAGFSACEKGIFLMQQIVDDCKKTGKCETDIGAFQERVVVLAGPPPAQASSPETAPPPAEAVKEEHPEPAKKVEIQDESLLKDFITEGLEYIEEIEVNILNLEQNPEDKDVINAIFRPFHSVKGVAGFLNLEDIRTLAHNLENLLDKARNDQLRVTPPLIDLILDGADVLKTMIGRLRDELEGRPLGELGIDLKALYERIALVEAGKEEVPRTKKIGEILLQEGAISKEVLEEGLKLGEDKPEKKIGEVLIEEGKVTARQVSQALRKQADQVSDATTIRVDTRKLDDLIDMVGELVITQSMIQQRLQAIVTDDRNLMRDMSQLFQISSGLQRSSTSLRMIPIKQTFQRMSRLVRDLAKNSGKLIAVDLIGEDTEIDRNMVDEIYNPLVHMIRNSVDHGLETPEDRLRAGKPEKGLICLKAYHRGGNVVIEIIDDGRGLNREKIIAKAMKSGVIQGSEGLSDQEIYRLVFLPGFSTAEKVTDVSGRGVGMDVVKKAVEKLRGKIEIDSNPGKGTTFVTKFPLTMAIIDGMIVKVGHERYILPTTAIRQTLRPARESYNNVVGKGEMLNVMGQLLPLVRLYELFQINPEFRDPWDCIVVVVEGESRAKCLMVDTILGKAEVVVKSLGEGLRNIRGVSGGAIMGDGQIGLILDPEGLFEMSENR